MKIRFLLILLGVSLGYLLKAQDYKVVSVESMPLDMTAREYIKQDERGRQCAVFRIATQNIASELREGFHFECDYASYAVERQIVDGEVWVWVSPGLKTLKIKHTKLGTLELHAANYGIKVESLHTYKIVLQGTLVATFNGKPEATKQYLAFQITPSNATLEVNGEKWEVGNDGSAIKYVPFGNYSYRVQALDYHPFEGTVLVDDARNTKKVPVNLNPNFGWVEVLALGNLQDASVYVDNVFLNNAPCKSKALKSGIHNLRITKELYDVFDTTFVVNDNETTILSPVLKTSFDEVTLTVDADAEIWVNGQKKGVRIWRGPLDKGTYTIECRQKGCEATIVTQEIDADAFKNAIKLPIPQPVYGSLSIESTPSFAEIFLDDNPIGETPLFVPDIPVGKHELRLVKQGYSEYMETIDVRKDQPTQIQISLDNSFAVWFNCNVENARLTIDDKFYGNANGVYELPVGKHRVLATAFGYQDYRKTIEVGENNTNFPIGMRSLNPDSKVQFICNASKAQLSIDGNPAGSASDEYELNYGTHHIKVTAGGYLDYESDIEIFEKKHDIQIDMEIAGRFDVKGVPLNMIWVEGGTFLMGSLSDSKSKSSTNAKQNQNVILTGYFIGETEVTQALWKTIMDNNPSINVGDDNPVDNVSWDDCQEFIRKLNQMTGKNFRLPTEAEWEFAARGGNSSENWIYSGSDDIRSVGWYLDNSKSSTSTVKEKLPNELGLYDMTGNVFEWCNDWYGDYEDGVLTNPQGPSSGIGRVIRGGSYANFKEVCIITNRSYGGSDKSSRSVGFRLALSE